MNFSLRSLLIAIFLSFPFFVFSAGITYHPLQNVRLPNGDSLDNPNILQYLANIYTFAIAIAGGLAVIRIVYSGIKYMLTDIVTAKGEARKEIEAAVYGLLVAICSFVFLNTLNPNLVKFNLFIPQSQQMEGDGRDLINGPAIANGTGAGASGGPGGTVGTGKGSIMEQIQNGAQLANPEWNAYALEQIRASGILDLPIPSDASSYFPNGIPTAEGYLSIMATLAERESGGQAVPARYLEKFTDNGTPVYSVGLLSLSWQDLEARKYGYSNSDLENPYNNIKVGTEIMTRQIRNNGNLGSLSKYWSTF